MRHLGIDEAGRGCVLGDLFVGAFWVDDVPDTTLSNAGAADSKKLSAKRRLAAREQLTPLGGHEVIRIPPSAIDTGNLNTLEENAIVDLLNRVKPDRVTIDALGHPRTLPGLIERLKGRLDQPVDMVIEPKADHRYPVVGAASIFAKTARDEALADLASTFGVIGSGYPSDPKTRTWLLEHAKTKEPWPFFVRTRWQTVQDLAQQALLG